MNDRNSEQLKNPNLAEWWPETTLPPIQESAHHQTYNGLEGKQVRGVSVINEATLSS